MTLPKNASAERVLEIEDLVDELINLVIDDTIFTSAGTPVRGTNIDPDINIKILRDKIITAAKTSINACEVEEVTVDEFGHNLYEAQINPNFSTTAGWFLYKYPNGLRIISEDKNDL